MSNFIKNLFIGAVSTAAAAAAVLSANVFADWKQFGYMGDLNNDKDVTIADMVIMAKHLLGETTLTAENGYDLTGKIIGINGADGFLSEEVLETADMNGDGRVDVYDLVILRKQIVENAKAIVWEWKEEDVVTTGTITTSPGTVATTTTSTLPNEFISPPVGDLYGSLPSQGDAEIAVFYVDFPDCRYDYMPTADEIEKIAFGDGNENNANYPFESMSAFYERSSKGSMKLDGKAYTYTAKNSKSYYENDVWHVALVDEIIAEFDAKVDFSEFDGNNDKVIDAILISVPTAAGDDNWWPAAGVFGGNTVNRADGMNIGHVIVGNAQIKSADSYSDFNSPYLHEMGHCMGLPDYYLYGVDDFQGMHGSAGFELMDDAICDFGAASKLMLGWYSPEQVRVYGKSGGTQSFTLNSGQKSDGNCVIIPVGDLDKNYFSEFFVLEYTDLSGNNNRLTSEWWRATGSGVRMYHVEAAITGDYWYNTFKYQSGSDEATNYNNGRRFIRLVGEGTDDTDNLFRTGDVIDGSTIGFKSYDSSGAQTGNMGLVVKIGEKKGDSYEITISSD